MHLRARLRPRGRLHGGASRSPIPPANAEAVLRQARACAEEGVAVAVFPELVPDRATRSRTCCSRTRCSTASRRRSPTVAEGSADLLPLLVVGAPLRHRSRIYNCAVVVHRGRILGVAPKSYLPDLPRVLRAPPDRRRATTSAARSGLAATTCRSVPTCSSRPRTCPGSSSTRRSARTCGFPCRRAREAALAGATVLLEPLRQPDHGRARRGPQAHVPRRSPRAASPRTSTPPPAQGESTTDLSWDGQTMIYENGVLLAETERFPDGDRRSVADVDLDLLRQERMRMGTFDDNRRTHARAHRRLPPHPVQARARRRGDLGLRREARALPVRARRRGPGSSRTATRPTTSRSPGLQQRLDAIGDPKVVIGVSGGLDSTHALIVAAKAMDRAGRPRTRHPGLHAAGLRDERRDQGQRARADARRSGSPPPRSTSPRRRG